MKYSALPLTDVLLPAVRYNHLHSQEKKTKNNYCDNFCYIIIIDWAAIV